MRKLLLTLALFLIGALMPACGEPPPSAPEPTAAHASALDIRDYAHLSAADSFEVAMSYTIWQGYLGMPAAQMPPIIWAFQDAGCRNWNQASGAWWPYPNLSFCVLEAPFAPNPWYPASAPWNEAILVFPVAGTPLFQTHLVEFLCKTAVVQTYRGRSLSDEQLNAYFASYAACAAWGSTTQAVNNDIHQNYYPTLPWPPPAAPPP